jgi:hypothetical protein
VARTQALVRLSLRETCEPKGFGKVRGGRESESWKKVASKSFHSVGKLIERHRAIEQEAVVAVEVRDYCLLHEFRERVVLDG